MRTVALLSVALLPVPACAQPPEPPPLLREFRAAWITTLKNSDWPSRPGLPTAAAQRELDTILDAARGLGLNAVVLQVRPAGDALYRSQLEPWSEWLTGAQGRAPDPPWDPLAYAIAAAHARGLELHAWINPLRARHAEATSPLAAPHLGVRQPGLLVAHDGYLWFDPGQAAAREQTLKVAADLVARYDLDGLHYDDYFYPYPGKASDFADDATFAAYRRGGGKLARADWRRANIDALVAELYRATKAQKPWVKVGISPFGIARPGKPPGIDGLDQYEKLYADPEKWLAEGLCDYMAPQLYWPIDQKKQSFALLAPWWANANPRHRHLWPGLSPGRTVAAKPPYRPHEIEQQIGILRQTPGIDGHIHFGFATLQHDRGQIASSLRRRAYAEPALVPPSPWLGDKPPASPELKLARRDDRLVLSWTPRQELRFLAVQTRRAQLWSFAALVDAQAGSHTLPGAVDEVAVTALDRCGLAAPVVRLRAP